MRRPAWSRVSLVELCESPDHIRCGPFGTQLSKGEFRGAGVPLWGIKHVNAEFHLHTEEFVAPETAKRLINYDLRSGDLVMTRKGTIGNCAVYPKGFSAGIMHSDLLRLRLDPCKADPSFLVHQLHHSADVHRQLSLISGGAVMPGINVGKLKKLEVWVPPLDEQKRIAAILDAADALRAKRREALAQLDTLVQSVFLDMFGDPVTNPMGWSVEALHSLLEEKAINGAYYPKEAYCDHGTPMVAMADAFYGIVDVGKVKRVDVPAGDLRKYGLRSTDLLVSRRSLNYEGSAKPCRIPETDERLIFESSLIRVRPDLEAVHTVYLFHYLQNERARARYVFPLVTRSTISGINQSNLMKVKIVVPALSLQRHFAAIVESVEKQKAVQRAHLAELDTLFASLQSRAFRGEL